MGPLAVRAETIDKVTNFMQAKRMTPARVLFATQFSRIFLRFGSNVLITRLLFPEAFAIMVLMATAIMIVELLTETGVGPFTVRREEAFEKHFRDSIWTLLVMRGIIITVVLFITAPLIARMYDLHVLENALKVTAFSALIRGCISLRVRYFQRTGREGYNAIIDIIAYILQLIFMLTLAGVGNYLHHTGQSPQMAAFLYSHWPLVLGGVLGALLRLIASYTLYPEPWHSFSVDKKVYSELWKFSRFLLMSSMITIVIKQFDKIYLANVVDLAEFAFYSLALMVVVALDTVIIEYYTRVYYAAISKEMRANQAGPDIFYGSQTRPRLALIFICAGGIFGGQALFEILYDDRYVSAGTYFSALVIKCLLTMWSQGAESYLLASNKTKAKLIAESLRLVWMVPAVVLGFEHFGMLGVAMAVALSDILVIPYYYFLLGRMKVLRFYDEFIALGTVGAGLFAGFFGLQLYQMTVAPYFSG